MTVQHARSRQGIANVVRWTQTHAWPLVLGLMGALLIVDWMVIDLWQIRGRVTDRHGNPIGGAWILANFNGEKPLVRLPIPPHPKHRTSECMGARVTTTASDGSFRFRVLARNRPLANKSVYIIAFKPGWLTETDSVSIRSSIFAIEGAPDFVASLDPGPGERRRTTLLGPAVQRMALDPLEHTRSDELFDTEGVLVHPYCGSETEPALKAALQHALKIAETFDERERVRGACGFVKKAAKAGRLRDWPFDCDNLSFEKEPRPEVLAAEAELVAKRRAWRDSNLTEESGDGF